MKRTRRPLRELQPLDSDLIKAEFGPFWPWGEPKWILALSSKQFLFSHGQGLLFSLLCSPEHSVCSPS